MPVVLFVRLPRAATLAAEAAPKPPAPFATRRAVPVVAGA